LDAEDAAILLKSRCLPDTFSKQFMTSVWCGLCDNGLREEEMALVYKVVIQCPVTGGVIDRGIRTAGREVVSSGLFQDGLVSCPYCSQMHDLEDNSYLEMDRGGSVNGLWRPNR
jgi:hypothetical protein